MDCEWVRDRIAPGENSSLDSATRMEIESHLRNCTECAAIRAEIESVTRRLKSWREENPPEWRRLPLMPSQEPRRPQIWSWIPTAAALLLVVFALGRAELRVNREGWSLSFSPSLPAAVEPQPQAVAPEQSAQLAAQPAPMPGASAVPVGGQPAPTALDKTEIQRLIAVAIEDYQQRSNQQLNTLLAEVRNEQRGEMGQWLKDALVQTQAGNERQLQLIFTQFNAQRAADIKSLNEQFNAIYQNQDYQAKSLRSLNNLVAKQSNYTP